MALSILEPLGHNASTCGYCSEPGKRSEKVSSFTTGIWPHQLSCQMYQRMIDRGWRRSGEYLYKPALDISCCPQYTIRLSALEFVISKTQRKLVNKFNNFILYPKGSDDANSKPKAKGKHGVKLPSSLPTLLHNAEASFLGKDARCEHDFTVTLERSSFTQEKYQLYCEYQQTIHKDTDNTPRGFTRFLVDSPLSYDEIYYSTTSTPAHLPTHFGAYHQVYRVDGELIAIGVIDVLPNCVSSVYFMYDPKWAWASLGKLSALREVALAQEMHACGVESMQWQYMGFYVHSCAKMKYKGEYSPSYLLDPEGYTWYPFSQCTKLLDQAPYVSFAHPERIPTSSTSNDSSSPSSVTHLSTKQEPSLQMDEDSPYSDEDDEDIFMVVSSASPKRKVGTYPDEFWDTIKLVSEVRDEKLIYVSPLNDERWLERSFRRVMASVVDGLGEEIAKDVLFYQ